MSFKFLNETVLGLQPKKTEHELMIECITESARTDVYLELLMESTQSESLIKKFINGIREFIRKVLKFIKRFFRIDNKSDKKVNEINEDADNEVKVKTDNESEDIDDIITDTIEKQAKDIKDVINEKVESENKSDIKTPNEGNVDGSVNNESKINLTQEQIYRIKSIWFSRTTKYQFSSCKGLEQALQITYRRFKFKTKYDEKTFNDIVKLADKFKESEMYCEFVERNAKVISVSEKCDIEQVIRVILSYDVFLHGNILQLSDDFISIIEKLGDKIPDDKKQTLLHIISDIVKRLNDDIQNIKSKYNVNTLHKK